MCKPNLALQALPDLVDTKDRTVAFLVDLGCVGQVEHNHFVDLLVFCEVAGELVSGVKSDLM